MTDSIQRQGAPQPPLPCFGLEHQESDPACQTCRFQEDCKVGMGKRSGRVTIDRLRFRLVPDGLVEIKYSQDDELRVSYNECFKIIFKDEFAPDNILKHEGAYAKINSACAELRCPVKIFLLTVMYGHKLANPHSQFWSNMLMGDAAKRRLTRYRHAVELEYGSFDGDSLDLYSGESLAEELIENKIKDSEVLAGFWITGFKIKKPGDFIKPFFEANEIRLDDLWLALEPSYFATVLKPWIDTRSGTHEEVKKRIRVSKLIGHLKRSRKVSIAAFKARERILPGVIQKVVNQLGFKPTDFEIPGALEYSSPLSLWPKLGLAIQHLYCLQALAGDRVAKQILSHGSVLVPARDNDLSFS